MPPTVNYISEIYIGISAGEKHVFVSEYVLYSLLMFSLVPLYTVLKSQGIRLESFPKCDFIPIDYYDARHVKSSFKKLMRACVPSSPYTDPDKGFLRAVEESEWLMQLQCILQIAGAVVDLLEIQGSSVMACLEDGWDFSAQVTNVLFILSYW